MLEDITEYMSDNIYKLLWEVLAECIWVIIEK